jgi:hypothetical protein
MRQTPTSGPDHSLAHAPVRRKGEKPRVFDVADLRAYIKPDMKEELSSPEGGAATLGTVTVCACVPVEDCVCNAVTYYSGSNPCPTHSGGGGGGGYWAPCH